MLSTFHELYYEIIPELYFDVLHPSSVDLDTLCLPCNNKIWINVVFSFPFSNVVFSSFNIFTGCSDVHRNTMCPAKHDSWWIFQNVFFLRCLKSKRIIKNIVWQSYHSKMDFKVKYIWVTNLCNEINWKKI